MGLEFERCSVTPVFNVAAAPTPVCASVYRVFLTIQAQTCIRKHVGPDPIQLSSPQVHLHTQTPPHPSKESQLLLPLAPLCFASPAALLAAGSCVELGKAEAAVG